ncbi:photosystem reaction center protein H [Ferroacidibacillus organovorans]|uniref:Photosystem reaction center protein H n=2 Tax=Ferroacidibacillus organovorans TaxID=1765683 RepID=A0A162UM73_9BACL|nr:photosystem reaction center protein H [Ferroacidibacillus organovorans]OAG94214.1 photosystem reaction center protein H [Ferroacidibacillus organovorans]OPG16211.1 YlmC/YmxH family sporulation protein [Ferroacidibacillus organovorans]
MMRASELQAKDVINIGDGRRLGSIGDLDIDLDSGMIKTLIIPPAGKFFGMFASGEEVVISFTQIVKIGSDVVLVDLRAQRESPLLSSHTSHTSNGY